MHWRLLPIFVPIWVCIASNPVAYAALSTASCIKGLGSRLGYALSVSLMWYSYTQSRQLFNIHQYQYSYGRLQWINDITTLNNYNITFVSGSVSRTKMKLKQVTPEKKYMVPNTCSGEDSMIGMS